MRKIPDKSPEHHPYSPVSSTHLESADGTHKLSCLDIIVGVRLAVRLVAWVWGQLELHNVFQRTNVFSDLWQVRFVQKSQQQGLLVVESTTRGEWCTSVG